jgi:hypothetical protein
MVRIKFMFSILVWRYLRALRPQIPTRTDLRGLRLSDDYKKTKQGRQKVEV